MNEWIRKFIGQLKALWEKWTNVQKIILFSIAGAAILAIVLIIVLSAAPSMVPLLGTRIADENAFSRIVTKLDEENVDYQIRSDNRIYVSDDKTAKRIRSILIREDLIPPEVDPWELFDQERWTITDFERKVNLQRAITNNLEQHIRSLDDIDAVSVTLVVPEPELFVEDEQPVSASIIITPKPGSDIRTSRKKIEGIVKLVKFAVEGLTEEHIGIFDRNGVQLNVFDEMEDFDRIALVTKELSTRREIEQQYKREILGALAQIFTRDRVQIINLTIDIDLSKKEVNTEEHFPITMKEDNPRTPFDETEVVPSITLSMQNEHEKYEGTGFNPEGPPGQEGQTPPAYKDLSTLNGKYEHTLKTQNEVVNTRTIFEQKSPEIKRITVAVALDGIWTVKYDEKGQVTVNPDGSSVREYTPVPDSDIMKATALIRDAIGYSQERGDSVTVEHLQFDRSKQFAEEDSLFRRQIQLRRTILSIIIGVGVLFLAVVVYRLVSKEIERRRRLREEELARQHQAMREAALRSAEEKGVDVELSVEDRARMELQENAINLAREHPEDVAQLVKTWLMEE